MPRVANSYPIKLTDVINAYTYDSSSIVRTDTFTTVANGSVTAPSTAAWCKIELWGGGGGGRGYNSIGSQYGGGGGGYVSYIVPVEGGVTTMGYRVGNGGSGGAAVTGSGGIGSTGGFSHANGVPGLDDTFVGTLYAYGGKPGYNVAPSTGGFYSLGGAPDQNLTTIDSDGGSAVLVPNCTGQAGANGTTTTGGTGANGGAGGSSSGAAGTAPGGGGAPGYSSGVVGGAGAQGKVVFTWYGKKTSGVTLRSFLSGGSYVPPSAVGDSGKIPTSGTLKISDFKGADAIGYYANNVPNGVYDYNAFLFYGNAEDGLGGSATAYSSINIAANGIHYAGFTDGIPSNDLQRWMERFKTIAYSTLTDDFDVLWNPVIKFGQTMTAGSSSANTWIQASTNPKWFIYASQIGNGASTSYMRGYLAFRRRSDNATVANVYCNVYAYALVWTEDTK